MADEETPRIRALLAAEQAGRLSKQDQADIATLRAAGQFPAALASGPAPESGTTLGRAYQNVRSAVGRVVNFLDDPTGSFVGARRALERPPASEMYNPLPENLTTGVAQTAVGLAPGGATIPGAVTRIGAGTVGGATGAALEGRSPVRGAVEGGLPTAAAEVLGPTVGKALGSLPGMQRQFAGGYARQLGENLEQTTGGILAGARTPADLDALVYGSQGSKGQLVTGRRQLGDFYETKVTEATKAIGHQPINAPTIAPGPISLADAVHEVTGLAASQQATNPAFRTAVGRDARLQRQTAWKEIEGELQRLDPSGAAAAAIQEARNKFGIGVNVLEAIKDSGAIRRGPGTTPDAAISFDSDKFQNYVSRNRAKFINRFDLNGTPEAWPEFVRLVFREGPVGSRDILARTDTMLGAAHQLARSGGGASTGALLPVRTVLPGLGSRHTALCYPALCAAPRRCVGADGSAARWAAEHPDRGARVS